jgi:hypothetical protein
MLQTMKPYSKDLRRWIARAVRDGMSKPQRLASLYKPLFRQALLQNRQAGSVAGA